MWSGAVSGTDSGALIAARLLAREAWEPELRFYGCTPLAGKGKLNTAEWWRMPWQDYPFTVPVEEDGRMLEDDLQRLVVTIVNSAPPGTEFPH